MYGIVVIIISILDNLSPSSWDNAVIMYREETVKFPGILLGVVVLTKPDIT